MGISPFILPCKSKQLFFFFLIVVGYKFYWLGIYQELVTSYCWYFQISNGTPIEQKTKIRRLSYFNFPPPSPISFFFHRISPCITQLEEQWQDLDLTSWQIQGCQTMTPVLWFNKPCHLHSPVRSLRKHLPQIDRLGESISMFSFLQFSGSSSCMDIVLVVLKVQLHADQMLFSWGVCTWFCQHAIRTPPMCCR